MSYESNSSSRGFPLKAIFIGVLFVVGLIAAIGLTGKNNDQDWQVKQSMGGEIEIIDRGGYYLKGFSSVWTYPKYMQLEFTEERTPLSPNDDSVTVTFTDGGTA